MVYDTQMSLFIGVQKPTNIPSGNLTLPSNMAIDTMSCLINSMRIVHSHANVCQTVNLHFPLVFLCLSYDVPIMPLSYGLWFSHGLSNDFPMFLWIFLPNFPFSFDCS